MRRVLISWIGQRDLDAVGDDGDGPVLATMRQQQPDQTYLLFNYEPAKVQPYLEWLRHKAPALASIDARHALLRSPIDYTDIYQAAEALLQEIWDLHPSAHRSILISPGTPAMQAVWILLGKTRFPADFLQASPQQGVQPVQLPFAISAEFQPADAAQAGRQLRELVAADVPETAGFERVVTGHPRLQDLKRRAAALARFDVPVLVLGESGTGKELFARAIHNSSARSERPFVAVNCGAIPPELIDSILFGHAKGAFTGALRDAAGVFEQADGGTLFLDELGELSAPAQVRLLRVLQEGRVVPVGADKEREVDFRLICATHRDLQADIAERRFREDLYYRVAVGVLELPPLRERQGDVHRLTEHFLIEIGEQLGFQHTLLLTPTARNRLLLHAWLGNVRELRAALLRAALWTTDGRIDAPDIDGALLVRTAASDDILNRSLGNGFDLDALLHDVERHYLERAMRAAEGSKTKASRLLGLGSHQVLTTRLRRQGLDESPRKSSRDR
ncbi:sigma-54-dependent Fis family transcriptional regulator [Thiorhodococcus mannitoliphagus]|uniref:Sigma-54-dependent Fis family transcriptional regulator n=1 Tax=Thiorhodococcus mannitoliphagus TaxID=329406 RepID=A0A6P1DSE5_9GAMM|nr:sigma-54 dependent transcriptional regulator [Thiorhodococcus mannitoliphagus]NEX21207.1 sigma-54-dependent Fis family transcriptional regulator [Thiorhodococcus mannitoliphagus]